MRKSLPSAPLQAASHRRDARPFAFAVAGFVVLPLLTGCGVSNSTPSADYSNPVRLQGQVFAGRNYMPEATVRVYVTQPSGTVSGGSYTGKAKLLATTQSDATGGWSVHDLSCSSPDQLYVTAEGGTPYPATTNSTPLSNNPNSLLMTAIGDCSLLTNSVSNNITSIVTNEASTIAAVWALRNFISLDGTTVNVVSSASNYAGTQGRGTVASFAGLAHAFLNANLLSPYKLGNFVQYTNGAADGTAGGLVPVQELNSLAYAQYLCTIGGDGATAGDFSNCSRLYALATPPGGAAPTNSLAAMLNIARFPAQRVQDILSFTLTPIPASGQTAPQQINAGVYVPALSAIGSMKDWSVAIYYLPGFTASNTAQGPLYPFDVTLNANDEVFFSNGSAATSVAGNVLALSSAGQSLWTSTSDKTNLIQPRGIAADASGHVWVVNGTSSGGQVQEMDAANGNVVARFASPIGLLYGIAVDAQDNVWYSANSATGQTLRELQQAGSAYKEAVFPVAPALPGAAPIQIRPDRNGNIWVSGYSTSMAQVGVLPNTGTSAAPAYAAGLNTAALTGNTSYGVTLDAAGRAYSVTNASSGTGTVWRSTLVGTGAGTVVQATNATASAAASGRYLDTDGVGDIWYLDGATGTPLLQYTPASNSTVAHYPCYADVTSVGSATAQTCGTGISTRQDFAIDSTGTIWVASYGNAAGGRLVQILGLAAPTVPLRSLAKPGVMP